MSLFDPRHLADLICERWHGIPLLKGTPQPDRNQLATILEAAFAASLHSEEGRQVQVRLMLASKDDVQEHGYISATFDRPRRLTTSEIRQLAPATEPSRTLIGVEESREGPLIWGFLTPGSGWFRLQSGEQRSGTLLPLHLVVTASGPGCLRVDFSDWLLWSASQGERAHPIVNVLKKGPVHDFFLAPIRAMLKETFPEQALSNETGGTFFSYSFGGEYRRFLVRVLSTASVLGHGGTVFFVRDDEVNHLEHCLKLKFLTRDLDLWNIVKDAIRATRDSAEAWKAMTQASSVESASLQEWRIAERTREDISQRFLDAARFVGALTQVDGATIITDRLRVLGFGAMVRDLSTVPAEFIQCEDENCTKATAIPSEEHGARHRSAMSLVNQVDAVAFVLSQDGGVKAIRRVEGKVMVWPSVALGPHSWFITGDDIISNVQTGFGDD